MRSALLALASILRLTRVTTAFAAVANLWFVVLWTRGVPEELEWAPEHLRERPLWLLLAGGALAATGLYAFAASVNDVLDSKRDRALRPRRPIPSGEISPDAAGIVVSCTLIAALLGSAVFDLAGMLATLALAIGIIFYNTMARFVPTIGVVVLGLLYAGHMLVPNVGLRFLVPVWLIMTHALFSAGLGHLVGAKIPRFSRRGVVVATLSWIAWSAGALWLGHVRAQEQPGYWPSWVPMWAVAGPAVLAFLFAVVCVMKFRRFGFTPRAIEKIGRYATFWCSLYGCAWLAGVGQWKSAALLGGLAACGWVLMTALREIYGLMEQPVGFRR